MQIGIVGLPGTGKTALFNALTKARAATGPAGFSMEPNRGVVHVPDPRLAALSEMYEPKKTTPATVDFVDIAGLVAGSSKGEGRGNQFLAHIRTADALVHVVRCFENLDGPPAPVADVETIETELILADLESVEKQMEKAEREARKGAPEAKSRFARLQELEPHLSDGKPARTLPDDEGRQDIFMLTDKPVLYVANAPEDFVSGGSPCAGELRAALGEDATIIEVSAQIESELADLSEEEARDFMADLGLTEPGLDRLIRASYDLLGLMSFLTAGKDECRAWSIPKGTRAQDAAREIHSDIARGFIRAEIINWEDLVKAASWSAAKEQGQARLEGRDYIMRDGDVVNFRFQV